MKRKIAGKNPFSHIVSNRLKISILCYIYLSSANASNLDNFQILSFGKELKKGVTFAADGTVFGFVGYGEPESFYNLPFSKQALVFTCP